MIGIDSPFEGIAKNLLLTVTRSGMVQALKQTLNQD
jgi:hypothetical protein